MYPWTTIVLFSRDSMEGWEFLQIRLFTDAPLNVLTHPARTGVKWAQCFNLRSFWQGQLFESGTEESLLAFKTVCSALFMLFCIDDTVSPRVGRCVFSQPFSLSCPQGEWKWWWGETILLLLHPYSLCSSVLPAPISPCCQPLSFTDH